MSSDNWIVGICVIVAMFVLVGLCFYLNWDSVVNPDPSNNFVLFIKERYEFLSAEPCDTIGLNTIQFNSYNAGEDGNGHVLCSDEKVYVPFYEAGTWKLKRFIP